MAVKDHLSDRLAELSRLVAGTGGTSPTHDFFARHFGLPGNPFPPPGIADATGENPPLRKRDVDTIINFIERGYTTGQSQFMVIKGEYGSGKTQALRYIEYVVNNYMNKGDHVARAIYIENPSLNVQELNRTILRALGQDAVKSYIWFPIYTMLLQDVQAQPQRFLDLRKNLLAQRGQRSRGRKQRSPVGIAEMGVKNAPAMNAPFDDVFNPQTILDYHTFLGTLVGKGWRREDVSPYLTTLLLEAVDLPNSVSLGQTFVALLLAANEDSFLSWERAFPNWQNQGNHPSIRHNTCIWRRATRAMVVLKGLLSPLERHHTLGTGAMLCRTGPFSWRKWWLRNALVGDVAWSHEHTGNATLTCPRLPEVLVARDGRERHRVRVHDPRRVRGGLTDSAADGATTARLSLHDARRLKRHSAGVERHHWD